MRHLLLHEGSRKAENSGAEYGRAPRIVSGTGTRTPFALPSRTLRHRARKSAVTYAKRGAQSGLKSFLPLSAGGTNKARPVIIARSKFETRSAVHLEARNRKKLADVIGPLLVLKQKTSIFACTVLVLVFVRLRLASCYRLQLLESDPNPIRSPHSVDDVLRILFY